MKRFIAIITILLGGVSHSLASEFYVIPVVTEVEVVKEVCTGVSAGEKVFELVGANFGYLSDDYAILREGEIYTTTNGKVVQITGTRGEFSWGYYDKDERYFRLAPSVIPAPEYGVKGPFYYTNRGSFAFAKYL